MLVPRPSAVAFIQYLAIIILIAILVLGIISIPSARPLISLSRVNLQPSMFLVSYQRINRRLVDIAIVLRPSCLSLDHGVHARLSRQSASRAQGYVPLSRALIPLLPGMMIYVLTLFGNADVLSDMFIAQLCSPSLWDVPLAAVRGPLCSGVGAPLRRYTDLAKRPAIAAVAGFGFGMRWHHARLRGPVPWALAERTLVPRRCCRKGYFALLGIGVA